MRYLSKNERRKQARLKIAELTEQPMTNESLISQLQLTQQVIGEALKKLQKEQKPKKRKGLSEEDRAKAIRKRENLINKA